MSAFAARTPFADVESVPASGVLLSDVTNVQLPKPLRESNRVFPPAYDSVLAM